MSSKRVRLISLIGIILIALGIGVSVLVNNVSKDTQEIALPSVSGSATDGTANTVNGLDHVKVTKDNVQAVIATLELERPEYYTRNIIIKDEYAVYNISAAVSGTNTALKVTQGQAKKNIIIADGKLYIWYDGDNLPYERPLKTADYEKKSPDEYQMIMSYEDVLAIDKSSIMAADYKEYNDENCIYVQYAAGLLHYTTTYYISVETGLLVGTQQYDGNTLIYTMTSSGYNETEPDPSVFNLPDGKSAVSAP